jgi:hypothetical protein
MNSVASEISYWRGIMSFVTIACLLLAGVLGMGPVFNALPPGLVAVSADTDLPPCPPPPEDPNIPWPPYPCKEEPPPEPSPSPPMPHAKSADLSLCLEAEPSGTLRPSDTIIYRLVAYNYGRDDATSVHVLFSFIGGAQEVVNATFTSADAWVSAVLTDELEMWLGPLKAGEAVTATLLLRIAPGAPLGLNLTNRARMEWADEGLGGAGLSNRVSLAVAATAVGNPTALLDIAQPAGALTTTLAATYDGFASNEAVSLWYHRPDGGAVGAGNARADAQGRLSYSLATDELTAGRYLLVAHGLCSRVSAVGVFAVAGQPAGP